MMSYDYSENILVQESAGHLLERELGWEVAYAYNTEKLGTDGTFGRTSYKEILLTRYFRQALQRLNPWLTLAQLDEAKKKMEFRLSTASLMQVNEEKYALIREGIPVTVKRSDGKTEEKRAQVIDFQNPANNHFLAIKELKIHGDLYRRRTDIVGFVNGIPLLFVELKKNTVDVQDAYTNNYTDYLDTIPHLFWYNAFPHPLQRFGGEGGYPGQQVRVLPRVEASQRAGTRAAWLWRPCSGASAKRRIFSICWKISSSSTTPAAARPRSWLGTTSTWASTRR